MIIRIQFVSRKSQKELRSIQNKHNPKQNFHSSISFIHSINKQKQLPKKNPNTYIQNLHDLDPI